MTTISSILSKTPGLNLDSTGKNDTPTDGAIAIFEAVLANLADQHLGEDGQDQPSPEINAEALLDQIMADDSISPYIETADSEALLPILEQVLENPDQMNSLLGTIPQTIENEAINISDHAEEMLATPIPLPASHDDTRDNTQDNTQVEASPMPGFFFAAQDQVSTTMSSVFTTPTATRGHYHQPKNPVQALASLLRKVTVAPDGGSSPKVQSPQAQPALTPAQDVMGPFPANTIESQRVAAHLDELNITVVAVGKSETKASLPMTPEAQPQVASAPQTPLASALPVTADKATLTLEEAHADHRASPVLAAAKPEAVNARPIPEGDDAIDIPYIKPVLFKPSENPFKTMSREAETVMAEGHSKAVEAQNLRPVSTQPTANPTSGTTLTSSGGDLGGQSGQNHSAQSGINTTMGLDEGRDGRLLRLSVSDQGWHERLVRQINSNRSGLSNERITVQLQPRNLGRMTLNISVANNTTHVQIITSTPEAAAMVQDAEARLHQAFDQNGMKLGQFHTANQFGQHQAQQGNAQHGAQDGNGKNASQQSEKNTSKDANLDENSSTKTVENANNSQINILA